MIATFAYRASFAILALSAILSPPFAQWVLAFLGLVFLVSLERDPKTGALDLDIQRSTAIPCAVLAYVGLLLLGGYDSPIVSYLASLWS